MYPINNVTNKDIFRGSDTDIKLMLNQNKKN